jgi:hypothetical protein
MMAEKPDPRFYTGLSLVVLGLPVHLSWVFWKKLKPWLGIRQLSEASAIATSLRWWLCILFVFLPLIVLSPFVEQRWPFSLGPITFLVSAALLVAIVSIIYAATTRSKRTTAQVPLHMALLVGHFWADFTKIKQQQRFGISLVLFNQTDQNIFIEGVRGNLTFDGFANATAISLEGTLPLTIQARQHDGATITIWQNVTKEEQDFICEAFASERSLNFYFGLVRFLVRENGHMIEAIRLYNFDGIACRSPQEGDIICNRVVSLGGGMAAIEGMNQINVAPPSSDG